MQKLPTFLLKSGYNSAFSLSCTKDQRDGLTHVFIFLLIFFCFYNPVFSQVTCTNSGTWTTATWSPAPPTTGQSILVNAGCTLTIDQTTPLLQNIQIDGAIIVTTGSTSCLLLNGDLIINNGAVLENNGCVDFRTPGKSFQLNGTATYVHNPLLNLAQDENIFFNGNESFSVSSNLFIKKWNDPTIPLGAVSRVQFGSFGNLTLSATFPGNGEWLQSGRFALPVPDRIRGNFSVTEGTVVMDEGSGNTISLILSNVNISANGSLVFQRGNYRNFSLTTGNFTVSTSNPVKRPSIIMDSSLGVLNWTVNGNLQLNHSFNALAGTTFESGGDARITVNGNANFSGGSIVLVTKADAPCRLQVSGTTTLNNTVGTVCFLDGGNGTFNFSTTDLLVQSGNSNYLFGLPGSLLQVKGVANFSITNDFIQSGSSRFFAAWADSTINRVRFIVGRDFKMLHADAQFTGAITSGLFTHRTGGNFEQLGGQYIGQRNVQNTASDSVIIIGNYTLSTTTAGSFTKINAGQAATFFQCDGNFSLLSSGLAYGEGFIGVDSSMAPLDFRVGGNLIQQGGQFSGILSGSGNMIMNITGTLDINAGIHRMYNNTIYPQSGTLTVTAGSIDYDGGVFSGYYACNNSNSTATFSITNTCKVNFTSVNDEFSFIGLTKIANDESNLSLNLVTGGPFNIQGQNGKFISSLSGASSSETITLNSLIISGGRNSFNSEPSYPLQNGHAVTMLINNDITVNGGTTYLSAKSQSVSITVNGNLTISNGDLTIKGGDVTGTGSLSISGGYNQSGGNFFIHQAVSDALNAGATIVMTVNADNDAIGDFNQSGGNLYFDQCQNYPGSMSLQLVIKSPAFHIGGTAQIITGCPATSTIYGQLLFSRSGTVQYTRSVGHHLHNVKQTISSGCVVDLVSGDLQLCSSSNSSPVPEMLVVLGTLNMRLNRLYSDAQNMFSGLFVAGRVATQHPQGIYNATANAAFSTTVIDSLDFFLSSSSVVEYNGVDNQIISGIGFGKARRNQHKYGILEINFTGTPDVEFVTPTNFPNDSAVQVLTSLRLTNGELNLDSDHDGNNGGGRMICLENTSTTMTRTNGYLRSEVVDGSAMVKWNIGNFIGARTIHYGYSSSEYIPFTYSNNGNSSIVYFATYHTAVDNLPYPPSVSHVRNNFSLDNSSSTVDRFWLVNSSVPGNVNVNLQFTATATEIGGLTNLIAHRWVASANAWTNPPPGVQTALSQGAQVNSLNLVKNWWTLSGNSSPLPVELMSFEGNCNDGAITLSWSTASETNNSHFQVERSPDCVQYEIISFINGHGTTSKRSDYSLLDHPGNFENSYVYYRLTQFDFDGKKEVFSPIAVKTCHENRNLHLTLLHGLAEHPIQHVLIPADGVYTFTVYSMSGQLVFNEEVYLETGIYDIPIYGLRLTDAFYLASVSSDRERSSCKWINSYR